MSVKSQLAIAAALAVGSLAFSANASAEQYRQATFKAEIKGTQTFQSEYHHASTDACDPKIDSSTKEILKFKSKPVKLTATDIPQAKELIFTSGTKPLVFKTKANLNRSHSYSASPVPEECGGNGGGVAPGPGPDCGSRTISPFPIGIEYYRRGRIHLVEQNASTDPFERCGSGAFPYLLEGETFGKRQSAELPENEVFDERIGKLITIGEGTHGVVGPESWDETHIRWELSLTRVKDKK